MITARNTDVGDLIQGDNTAPKELFHLAAVGKLRVYISVPEVYASAIKSGETVTLTLDAFPGENFAGTLVRDSNSIDLTSRTLRVEVDVDNPTGSLLPGAYAFVHLKLPSAARAVTIPTNTLLFRAEGLRVAVVRGGQAKLVPITIGHDYGSSVEVLSGLTSEDAVILDPSDSIMEGSAVKIAEAAKPEGSKRKAYSPRELFSIERDLSSPLALSAHQEPFERQSAVFRFAVVSGNVSACGHSPKRRFANTQPPRLLNLPAVASASLAKVRRAGRPVVRFRNFKPVEWKPYFNSVSRGEICGFTDFQSGQGAFRQ